MPSARRVSFWLSTRAVAYDPRIQQPQSLARTTSDRDAKRDQSFWNITGLYHGMEVSLGYRTTPFNPPAEVCDVKGYGSFLYSGMSR